MIWIKQYMKATNINNTRLKELIIGKKCSKCELKITEKDIKNNNYSIWFGDDYLKLEHVGDRLKLEISISEITHDWDEDYPSIYDCPENEKCVECLGKFAVEETKKGIDEDKKKNYCFPCFDKKFGEYLKARSEKKELTPEQKEILETIKKAVDEHIKSNWHHGGHDYSNCRGSECEGYKETLKSYGY